MGCFPSSVNATNGFKSSEVGAKVVCEIVPVLPSVSDEQVLAPFVALLSEHCELSRRFAPPGDDRATTSAR